jgi:hypothetical protein
VDDSPASHRPAQTRASSRSLPARIVAAGFVVLILVGNCWFVLRVIGQEIPAWLGAVSRMATAGVLGGGLLLVGTIVWKRLRRRSG